MKFGYPRPQMQRSSWASLNGAWRFCFDDAGEYAQPSQIKSWPLEIQVPFPPESKASGIGDRGFHSWCWYQRDFDCMPPSRAGDPALRRGRLSRAGLGQWSPGGDP